MEQENPILLSRGGMREVQVQFGNEEYQVIFRDYQGFPSVDLSGVPPEILREITPSWEAIKNSAEGAVRTLILTHSVSSVTHSFNWRIDAPAVAAQQHESPQESPVTLEDGVSPVVDGWMIQSVQVEEQGPWKNRMVIDLVCDPSGVQYGTGYGMNAALFRPEDRGYETVPTVVGYSMRSLKLDPNNPEDRDIEMVLKDVPLFWGQPHELHLSPRGVRKHITLRFTLTEDMKLTDIPEIRNLQVISDVKRVVIEKRPEITGKVKLGFDYDFGGEDAWFYVHHSNAHIWRSERIVRWNPEGRASVWVYLKSGTNHPQVLPYDQGTQETGKVASVTVVNPH